MRKTVTDSIFRSEQYANICTQQPLSIQRRRIIFHDEPHHFCLLLAWNWTVGGPVWCRNRIRNDDSSIQTSIRSKRFFFFLFLPLPLWLDLICSGSHIDSYTHTYVVRTTIHRKEVELARHQLDTACRRRLLTDYAVVNGLVTFPLTRKNPERK